jgi:type II secretory pathway component PulM
VKRWLQLAPDDRRALLSGAILVASALALRLGVLPYVHARAALVERLREQQALLQRETALVESASRVADGVGQATRTLDRVRSRLLLARDPLGAAALLVREVSEDARGHGVLVEAIESRPPESLGDDLTGIQVDVRGRGDLEGVLRWLHAIETGDRFLRVEQLSLARLESGVPADSLDVETLAFALSIRGFLLAPRPAASATVVAAVDGAVR